MVIVLKSCCIPRSYARCRSTASMYQSFNIRSGTVLIEKRAAKPLNCALNSATLYLGPYFNDCTFYFRTSNVVPNLSRNAAVSYPKSSALCESARNCWQLRSTSLKYMHLSSDVNFGTWFNISDTSLTKFSAQYSSFFRWSYFGSLLNTVTSYAATPFVGGLAVFRFAYAKSTIPYYGRISVPPTV